MNNTTANGSQKNLIEMLENSRQLYGDRLYMVLSVTAFTSGQLMNNFLKK